MSEPLADSPGDLRRPGGPPSGGSALRRGRRALPDGGAQPRRRGDHGEAGEDLRR